MEIYTAAVVKTCAFLKKTLQHSSFLSLDSEYRSVI